MKLLAYQINGETIGIDINTWSNDILNSNEAFITIDDNDTIPSNYIDISSIVNWDNFGGLTTLDNNGIKREISKLKPIDLTELNAEELIAIQDNSLDNLIGDERFYIEKTTTETITSNNLIEYNSMTHDFDGGIYVLTSLFIVGMTNKTKAVNYSIRVDNNPVFSIEPIVGSSNHVNKNIMSITKDVELSAGTHKISILFNGENKSSLNVYFNSLKLLRIK